MNPSLHTAGWVVAGALVLLVLGLAYALLAASGAFL